MSSSQDFLNLVSHLLQMHENQSQEHPKCTHEELKRVLSKKLQISEQQIYTLAEKVYYKMAKRKYELGLLQKIAKGTFKTIGSEFEQSDKSISIKNVPSQGNQQMLLNLDNGEKKKSNKTIGTNHTYSGSSQANLRCSVGDKEKEASVRSHSEVELMTTNSGNYPFLNRSSPFQSYNANTFLINQHSNIQPINPTFYYPQQNMAYEWINFPIIQNAQNHSSSGSP